MTSAFRLWDPQRPVAFISKVGACCVAWAVQPLVPKRHFLCVNEPIFAHNVRHPRHSHCIHIHKESKEPVGSFMKCDITLPLISIWRREKTSFTSSDAGIHLVFTLITSLRHWAHRWSLRGKNLADRKLWKKINLTFACSKEKWGRENSNRR